MRLLLTPLLSLATLSAAVRNVPEKYGATSGTRSSDLICHGENCYPRVFEPSDEFQVVHDDQELPPGLHYRLDLSTGLKEAKINVDDGSGGDVVIIPDHHVSLPEPPQDLPIQRAPASSDGPIKPPLSAPSEQVAFSESLEIVLDPSSRSVLEISTALLSLEDLAHEIYWGLQIADPRYVSGLLRLIRDSPEPTIRSSSALVLGSALSNNPKALASAASVSTISLIRTLLSSLESETDSGAKARILYALNQAVKSPLTRDEFLVGGGMGTLQELFLNGNAEVMAKTATFIEDNFLNDDMRSESEQGAKPALKKQGDGYTRYSSARDNNEEKEFYEFFEETLLNRSGTRQLGDDGFKSKIFSALCALKRKYPVDTACTPSFDFLVWLDDQLDLKGKTLSEIEEEGDQQTKVLAIENQGLFAKYSRREGSSAA